MLLGALAGALAGPCPAPVQAEPVVTVLRGPEPDGSEWLLEDVSRLWQANAAYDSATLAVKALADPRARLRSLRQGRAEFAVVDAATLAGLAAEFPDIVVLAALMPLPVHLLRRGGEPGPLKAVPGTLVYTGPARFVAEALAAPPPVPEPAAPPPGAVGSESPGGAPTASGASPSPSAVGATAASTAASLAAPPAAPLAVLRGMAPLAALEAVKGAGPDTLALVAAPAGTQEIALALRADPTLRLVPLDRALMETVRRDRPWVQVMALPRNTYAGQFDTVELLVAQPLLVTLPALPQDQARRMLDCLFARRDQVGPYNPLFAMLDRKANAEVVRWAPYHEVAVKEFGLTP